MDLCHIKLGHFVYLYLICTMHLAQCRRFLINNISMTYAFLSKFKFKSKKFHDEQVLLVTTESKSLNNAENLIHVNVIKYLYL